MRYIHLIAHAEALGGHLGGRAHTEACAGIPAAFRLRSLAGSGT